MAGVNAGVPPGSILGPLLLLIYINDLADGLSSNAKLFADDSSLFSVIRDVDSFTNELNNDLHQINIWTFEWKICFNPDTNKQAQENIFSRKNKKNLILHYILIIALFRNPHVKNLMPYFLIPNYIFNKI